MARLIAILLLNVLEGFAPNNPVDDVVGQTQVTGDAGLRFGVCPVSNCSEDRGGDFRASVLERIGGWGQSESASVGVVFLRGQDFQVRDSVFDLDPVLVVDLFPIGNWSLECEPDDVVSEATEPHERNTVVAVGSTGCVYDLGLGWAPDCLGVVSPMEDRAVAIDLEAAGCNGKSDSLIVGGRFFPGSHSPESIIAKRTEL